MLSLYDIVLAVNITRGEHQNTAYYGKGLLIFITSIPWTNIGHIRMECSKVRKKTCLGGVVQSAAKLDQA